MQQEIKYQILDLIRGEMPQLLRDEIQVVTDQANNITVAQQLLALCEIFMNKVVVAKNEYQIGQTIGYRYSMRRKRNIGVSREDLMVYGARLIYALRAFLNQDEIIYHIGIKADGSYSNSAKVSQLAVMENFKALGGRKRAVGLTHALEKQLVNSGQKDTIQFVNKWKRIEMLASVSVKDQYNATGVYKDGFQLLQKKNADTKVYYTMRQLPGDGNRKAIRSKYYDLNGKKIGFNDGWLWEWYDTIYNSKNAKEIFIVHQSIDAGNLEPLFLGIDKTPGVKSGDYINRFGQHVQDKYNNQRIISYNNIVEIMYEITNLLRAYINDGQSSTSATALTAKLEEYFIPNSAEGVSNSIAAVAAEQLFAPLKQFG